MSAHPDLPYEQAKNREYLVKLAAKLERTRVVAGARSAVEYHHPLLGRVGCDTDRDELRDFYIGPRYIGDDEVRVYSWAAPIARLFFQPDAVGTDNVVVRRTFTHHVTDVATVDDEWERTDAGSPFVVRDLTVPAPSRAVQGRRRRGVQPLSVEPDVEEQAQSNSHASSESAPAEARARRPEPEDAGAVTLGMRARDAVLERLAAPRVARLQSVLALLQPDQHELVSWPVDQSLAVQGHPGTGKTVVAAYRAAYLLNPSLYENNGALAWRRGRRLRVLVVGPTAAYVHHVEDVIKPLVSEENVRISHLGELMAETTGLKGPWPGGIAGEQSDVDAQARFFAERAVRLHNTTSQWREGPGARRDNLKAIYDLVSTNGTRGHSLVTDPDQIAWMRKLPPFERAFQRRYLPLMAQCRLAYNSVPDADKFDHIVVDEAQDVSPIEWNVLDEHLRRDGQWTLVGDMNQRRSDVTYGSWGEIADHLAMSADDAFKPEVMTRGYRSTGEILRFADKLLPTRQRGNRTVQEGGMPVALRRATRSADLWPEAVSIADQLASKYREGTTAIITVHPGDLVAQLGRTGWRREGESFTVWKRDGRLLRLYVPEDARGLEFDAVVVAEPGAFPENLGRTGQLYTSLTRANRELAVVWHGALPDSLRRAARH